MTSSRKISWLMSNRVALIILLYLMPFWLPKFTRKLLLRNSINNNIRISNIPTPNLKVSLANKNNLKIMSLAKWKTIRKGSTNNHRSNNIGIRKDIRNRNISFYLIKRTRRRTKKNGRTMWKGITRWVWKWTNRRIWWVLKNRMCLM